MAIITVTGYTALRCKAIEDSSIVDGDVVGNDLILTKYDGSTINAGNVRGPQGPTGNPPLVSTLPGSPSDGEEIYYQNAAMAAQGIIWHLKYRSASASAYKWEAVGSRPIILSGDATNNTTSDSYVAIGNMGTFTIPLAGDYDLQCEFYGGIADASNGGSALMSPWNASTSTAWGIVASAGNGLNTGADARKFDSASRIGRVTGTPVNTIFTARMARQTPAGDGTVYVWTPRMFIYPVRVG